jgi:hypothetical protein
MDKEKNFSPDKALRESLAKCKTFFEIAWSCRELNDMAGYADALADITEELNKYSPDIANCGMPISSAQVVQSTRRERRRQELDFCMDCLIRQMRAKEELLGIYFLSDLLPKS